MIRRMALKEASSKRFLKLVYSANKLHNVLWDMLIQPSFAEPSVCFASSGRFLYTGLWISSLVD